MLLLIFTQTIECWKRSEEFFFCNTNEAICVSMMDWWVAKCDWFILFSIVCDEYILYSGQFYPFSISYFKIHRILSIYDEINNFVMCKLRNWISYAIKSRRSHNIECMVQVCTRLERMFSYTSFSIQVEILTLVEYIYARR